MTSGLWFNSFAILSAFTSWVQNDCRSSNNHVFTVFSEAGQGGQCRACSSYYLPSSYYIASLLPRIFPAEPRLYPKSLARAALQSHSRPPVWHIFPEIKSFYSRLEQGWDSVKNPRKRRVLSEQLPCLHNMPKREMDNPVLKKASSKEEDISWRWMLDVIEELIKNMN